MTSQGPNGPTEVQRPFNAATLWCGALGTVVTITGTFLPWLRSGSALRNSYEVAGVAGRLFGTSRSDLAAVLSWWPIIGPLCILPALLAILRLRRTAATAAIVVGSVTVVIALGTLILGSGGGRGLSLVVLGPIVMALGGGLLVAAGVLGLVRRNSPTAASVTGTMGAGLTNSWTTAGTRTDPDASHRRPDVGTQTMAPDERETP